LSGVIRKEHNRFPVAWQMALAIAADTPLIPISPTPRTPIGLKLKPDWLFRRYRATSRVAVMHYFAQFLINLHIWDAPKGRELGFPYQVFSYLYYF
jgi:hypothetical protein